MAKLKKTVIGKLSGTLGDLVFRIRNGKSIVATRPTPSKVKNAESIERQNRFAIAGRLANAITGIGSMKYFWSGYAPSGLSANNFIVKMNYKNVSPDNISDKIVLMPSIGFSISFDKVIFDESSTSVEMNPIGNMTDIDPVTELKIACSGIIFLNDPEFSSDAKYSFISLSSESQLLNLNDPMTFPITFSDHQKQIYSMYNQVKGFFTLITFDADGKPVRFSNSIFSKRT